MSDQLLTVAQVCALPAGTESNATWVNPGFYGVCRNMERKTTKAGKPYWPCVIQDTTGSAFLEVSFWAAPKFKEGDTVEFSGKGLRRTEYNGKAQAALGKETIVQVKQAGAQRIQQAINEGREQHAQAASEAMINGAQVGGAVKAVFEAMKPTDDAMNTPEFWKDLHRFASSYVRVCQTMERGKLAPAAGGSASRPAPTPSHDPEKELDEDVPFNGAA